MRNQKTLSNEDRKKMEDRLQDLYNNTNAATRAIIDYIDFIAGFPPMTKTDL